MRRNRRDSLKFLILIDSKASNYYRLAKLVEISAPECALLTSRLHNQSNIRREL